MTPEEHAALRAPFPASAVGKLPKPYRKDSDKGNCTECGGYHGLPAVHLDYVGHAATTDRLLSVDPEWSWEPYATTAEGLPLLTAGGLWIKLTVCGVTRPGFGDGSSVKEQIGDAIRNAAMRFGVALDLWAKEDLSEVANPPSYATPEQTKRIGELLDALSPAERSAAKRWWRDQGFGSLSAGTLTLTQAVQVVTHLEDTPNAPEGEDS